MPRSGDWETGRPRGWAGVVPAEASGPRARGHGAKGHHREAGDGQVAATRQPRRRDVFPAVVAHKLKGEEVREME